MSISENLIGLYITPLSADEGMSIVLFYHFGNYYGDIYAPSIQVRHLLPHNPKWLSTISPVNLT
jgi:hypothetical protein